jgi:hypothetical protein
LNAAKREAICKEQYGRFQRRIKREAIGKAVLTRTVHAGRFERRLFTVPIQ